MTLCLPVKKGIFGSVTSRRLFRLLTIYLGVLAIGFVLVTEAHDPHLKIFGLGLIMPGGGFLAHARISDWSGLLHLSMTLLGIASFFTGVFIWFATGNVIAPPFIWLLFAAIAASMNHHHINENAVGLEVGLIACVAFFGLLSILIAKSRGLKKRAEINQYLSQSAASVVAQFKHETVGEENELSPDDLKRMHFLLDRALQPVNEFNGFEWLDQFQTAAVRYQINFFGYALSMAQATKLPALTGYIDEAQKRLIQKQMEYPVWRYWTVENLWGNLDCNPDPIRRENIMFTGFCATQIAMYHAASGRHDFTVPDSFSFWHPSGRSYHYDLPKMIEKLEQEMLRSDFHLMPCEPNWIYPLCNSIGASAIKAYSPETWDRLSERFRSSLEQEFIDYAGRIVPCRSNYTGLALPPIGGVMPQAMPSFFLNATLPDIALRQWLLQRRIFFKNGILQREKFWRIDTGNYRFSRAAAYSATALAAAEMGDDEVKQACLLALDEECPIKSSEQFYRPNSSIWAHAVEFLARGTQQNSFRSLIEGKGNTLTMPHFNITGYSDILVAKAVHKDDALQGVFYAGDEQGHKTINICGLSPLKTYKCTGHIDRDIVADEQGNATLSFVHNGRIELQIQKR